VFNSLLLTAGLVSAVVLVWPQALKMLFTRKSGGVSPATWTVSLVVFGGWTAYGVATHFWGLVAANASSFIAALLIIGAGLRAGWSVRWGWAGLVAVATTVALATEWPPVLAAAMAAGGVLFRLPQVVSLARSEDVAGVSAGTWWLSGVTSVLWVALGIVHGSLALTISSGLGMAMTVVLLALLYRRRWVTGRLQVSSGGRPDLAPKIAPTPEP
jgi:uncharacterized protein with PQ loop repeat